MLGLDNTVAGRREIAERISQRTGHEVAEIEGLMFACEDIIHGEPVGKKETVTLIERIRKLEDELGLKRAARRGL